MSKFIALLKVSIRSMLLASSGLGRGKKKKSVSGLAAMAMIAALAMYLSGVYSMALLGVLAPLHMEILVFIVMGLAALIGGLLFTTFGVSSTLYGGKDNDLMLSMPVSSTALMAARMAAIYIENLLFSFFMLVPAGVCCAIVTRGGMAVSLGFWARVLVAALALPLLDTALSVLVGAGLAWLSRKVTHKAIGQNLLMGVFLVAVFWFSFSSSALLEGLAANVGLIRDALGWAAPILWMSDGIMGDWKQLLLFAAACAVPFVLVTYVLGKLYRKAVTAFTSVRARSDYKLTGQRASGQVRALLGKEAQRFFGMPVYFWNCAIGLIMLVGMGVAAVLKRAELMQFIELTGLTDYAGLIGCALACLCLCLSPICAPSISLEGKQLWILRAAPMRERTIVWTKVGFQLLLTAPCILIGLTLVGIAVGMPALHIAGMLGFSLVLELGLAAFGMLIGILFARPDADPSAVIKRSLLSYLSIFAPVAALGILGFAAWKIGEGFGVIAAVGFMQGAVLLLTVLGIALLNRKAHLG